MASLALGIGGHQSARMGKDEWLTPPDLIRRFGPFDLDPCAPIVRPWDTAEHHYTIDDDGLSQHWHGRVWCNPPYGRALGKWLARCADHGNAVALLFARTETDDFFSQVWERAHGILFLRGRLHFHHVDGSRAEANSGAPSCLVAYGADNLSCLESANLPGQLVTLREA